MFLPMMTEIIFIYELNINTQVYLVHYLYGVYFLAYIIMNFISIHVIENKSMKLAIIIGVGIMVIGFGIRCFSGLYEEFVWLAVG